ncbi:HDOD domain-containing protein [Rhodoferax sp.]|uniref:HDOD domain-containing protein n=1 Tax=Rhodoferax sp. TaxID=50421 RepID=UPI00374D2E0B
MQFANIDQELELARTRGAVRDIVIPPCPELLVALQREVQGGDPDPAGIAQIASQDVAMAAALIRYANSPLFARSRPAGTVGEAIAMLGVKQTVGVLTGFFTRAAIRVNSALLEHFWETSTRRSLAMAYIARHMYGMDFEVAQTCGLFCHVGIPVMLQGVKGYAGTLAEALARQDRSFTATENAAHKTDHAVVGALVAKTWKLPPVVTAAVRLHHDFDIFPVPSIPAEVRNLVAMSLLAEHLVALHEGTRESQEWAQFGASCMAHLHIDQAELQVWADALHPVFENVV